MIFQKENGNTFSLFVISIVKSLQREQNSTNLLLWPPICRNKPAITPKWFNSLDTNSNSGPYELLKLFFDCHNFLPFEKEMILLEKQTGLQKLQIINWFTEQIQQVNTKNEDPTNLERIPDFETRKDIQKLNYYSDTDEEFHGFVSDDDTTLVRILTLKLSIGNWVLYKKSPDGDDF